ncbi:glycine zipper 2TM domain-containing protein [Aquabacterium sp. J223]|uniref:glycine zipper 2TM domain-containing protein n=1 Tax=Aquabacterium sp. J223 TaxID=2898431 RepID=UPI0021AD8DEA|nr:glycine zipper 2TM domain-containing protein [Aquabacterium sp. J223]UUX95888.1 glycine zipper 2TM domain-containing protein [Aquabacterium sp. J223]
MSHVRTTTPSRLAAVGGALAGLALFAGCTSTPLYDQARPVAPVTQSPALAEAVRYGRVVNVQSVETGRTGPGAGAVLGAVVGGVLGSQVGSGSGQIAATGVGAVAGGVAGHRIEQNRSRGEVWRVDVQFDDGRSQTFDFRELNGLGVGDRVRWENNQLYRL